MNRGGKERRDILVILVETSSKAKQVKRAAMDKKVKVDPLDPLDIQEELVVKVCQVSKVPKDLQESQADQVSRYVHML